LLATGLNSVSKFFREYFTFVYFLPSIISMVAISLVWQWLYHQHFGLINAILLFLGFEAQPFLNSSEQALLCLCIVEVWSIMGYYAVILLAAIRDIDLSLYEAARIDGANAAKQFRYITLPMIQPSLLFVLIMSTIASFMIFTPVKVLTDGAPGTSTMVLMLHILNRGIKNSDIGYAAAMSILLLLIILSVSLIQWALARENKRGGRQA
jgi:ABC-type sugar transport system permease subunit